MSDLPAQSVIPQPPVRPLLGNAPDIDTDSPVMSMVQLSERLGPIYKLAFPGRSMLVLGNHALAAEAGDEARFGKYVGGVLNELRALGGDGLFTADSNEENWGKAHRVLMPAFGPAAMRNYFDDMVEIADQMLVKWERFGPETDIDVADNMTRLTLDTIALCGFNYRFNSFYQREMHPFVASMVRALLEAGYRAKRLPLQNQLMFLSRRQFEADNAFMHGLTDELIEKRRKLDQREAPRDLLGLMLNAKDPLTGEGLDDKNIRYQLVTFLVAGHETTSGLLSFALHLLLDNPEVLEKAQAEVDRVLGDEAPRHEHLAQLVYVDQILRETLRLHPTAPIFAVHAREETTLGGRYPIHPEQALMVLLPSVHRDPAIWKHPERFMPERFAPGVRQEIPHRAWMPFGNGQRSCIGRAFSLQEATLVLAMLLQRFEITRPRRYRLVIKETLTMKPEGLVLRARARKPAVRGLAARPAPRAEPREDTKTKVRAPAHGTPLLLLFGSNSGASEAFARRIASDGSARGYATHVAPLDDHAGKLPREGAVAIITASYNGQPPDNARQFCTWLDGLPEGALSGVRYAVFGCGNRDWAATYQNVPRRVDEQLARAGATVLLPRGEGDARADFFGDFEQWYAPFWGTLGEALGVAPQEIDMSPLYEVEAVPSGSAELLAQNQLALATVIANRELVDLSSPFGRSKHHIEFTLPEGASYAAGDYLAVLPENHPDLVERAARRFGVRTDAAVVLRSTRGAMAASLPLGKPVSIQELLGRHVELSAPATRKDLERLAEKNPCPPHRAHLAALVGDLDRYKAEILDKRVSVLDLLETYPSCIVSFAEFLEMLPAMRVRQYSISSSPRLDPTRCTLTVSVLSAPAYSGNGQFHGTCSSYLARLRPGDRIPVAVRTPNVPFHPPASNETPVVMICAGTGLAPFRGFLQERADRYAHGEAVGEAVLYFGCDHPDVDFIYRDELMQWERDGIVDVRPAFFRKPDGEVTFVQHRVWQERERIRDLYEQGAIFFLCGDGQRMAPAVRATLVRIRQEAVGCTEEDATAWLTSMEREGRYVPDVFA
ncbi:bifunctional cytochrome P450/NADPH--P450 reductase [Chondromyces crocatus]|uniref:Bifunctional cytochrome P450/NADPH--P450 reductase n=1 Tax=Chondromyces crocatus TaxID=52 RepID=A0A0K1E5F6_CHOCO|nr:cytochrome P450 [Chondromyces crocatus]AKT36069.1 NADPH--cytochrome P450 reductase [Chondromyces crocatus]